MRIVLDGDTGPARVFWLQRNQCLGLLARIGEVCRQLGILAHSPAPRSQARPAVDGAGVEHAVPETLDGIRVRVEGERARVLFVQGERNVSLLLPPAGIGQLQEMLGLQAERAGWDPAAGLARLQANVAARAAISKTRQGAAGDEPRER